MQNDSHLISVIVPVYNAGKYFDNCVKSILNQTYKNLEIILVDDGSTDESGKHCDEFAAEDNRVKVIHKENGGAASARNVGLDAATGDYIGFVDADDYIDSDMYEIMLGEIIEFNADAARCGTVRELENGETEEWGTGNFNIRVVDGKQVLKDVAEGMGIIAVSPCNKLFSADCVKNVRFDTRFKFAEDVLFNFEAAKNIDKMVYHDVDRYHYMDNSSSMTNKEISENNFDEQRVMDVVFTLCDEETLPYAVKGDILKSFRTLRQIILSGCYTERFDGIRDRIVKHKKEVMSSDIYPSITKQRVRLLSLSPFLYKFAIKHLRRS